MRNRADGWFQYHDYWAHSLTFFIGSNVFLNTVYIFLHSIAHRVVSRENCYILRQSISGCIPSLRGWRCSKKWQMVAFIKCARAETVTKWMESEERALQVVFPYVFKSFRNSSWHKIYQTTITIISFTFRKEEKEVLFSM